MTSCTWTGSPAGETTAYPCIRHENGEHVFGDGHRLPLAVTAIAAGCPGPRRVPLEDCEDIETVLARHVLSWPPRNAL